MNIGRVDQALRVIIGAALIIAAATDMIGLWGYIGIIPLVTGLIRWCPAYTLINFRTTGHNQDG